MRSAVKPPEAITRTCRKPSASNACRTFATSRGLTPVGWKSPSSDHSERSTIVLEVSSRTPHSRSPNARAHASDVATESLSKSTRAISGTPGTWRANAATAATVSPLKVAISAWGMVPRPRSPHQAAWASVATPWAPPTKAA